MITKQDIEYANSMDIVSFLKARGMSAKRVGSTYEWQSPGGKVSIKGSKWYSQYERVGGHTIDFVKKYFGLDFKGAMEELLGKRYTVMKESGQEKPKKPWSQGNFSPRIRSRSTLTPGIISALKRPFPGRRPPITRKLFFPPSFKPKRVGNTNGKRPAPV